MSENTVVQTPDGRWVTAIPEPLYGLRKRCGCGQHFWTIEGYRGHFALVHALKLKRTQRHTDPAAP